MDGNKNGHDEFPISYSRYRQGSMIKGQWIWQAEDGPANTWMCFRKKLGCSTVPTTARARIAVDSKYWLWINGKLAVFEGGLNRGPAPDSGYYDNVDVREFLEKGNNTLAILVWYWGNGGRNSLDSGKGGLLFQIDSDGFCLYSDIRWKIRVHPAYYQTGEPNPANLYAGHNIGYNAQNVIEDWTQPGYDDSGWEYAVGKGTYPCSPWNELIERPIPFWKNHGLRDYINLALPRMSDGNIVVAGLPYAAHITPYLKIEAAVAGLKIDIRTDRYETNGGPGDNLSIYKGHRAEYITREGLQEFEAIDWLFGESVLYSIPSGVKALDLKFRETGYNADLVGLFHCSDDFYNKLYEKAKRTLYICMRDNFMDCPDRERGQWIGDVSSQVPQVFYSLSREADHLILKAIRDFIRFRKGDILQGNVPGVYSSELPSQSLNAIGAKGMILSYFMNTGDFTALDESYTAIKRYLGLWDFNDDGLIGARRGDWDWFDHGEFIDIIVLRNAWYYLALKGARVMAELTQNRQDIDVYQTQMERISESFNQILWKGDGYHSGEIIDDRANAMAVLAGLADKKKWPVIESILKTVRNATPYMEGYVLEALFTMGFESAAMQRMKDRYSDLAANSNTTLWEDFFILGTRNHAWSGGPLSLLIKYIAGVETETPGYSQYHVLPRLGNLTYVDTMIPSIKGNINISVHKSDNHFILILSSPKNTSAIVGIPRYIGGLAAKSITVIKMNGERIWAEGKYCSNAKCIAWSGEDEEFYRFIVEAGVYSFTAT
jgi:alpha-L-rhamnosidase